MKKAKGRHAGGSQRARQARRGLLLTGLLVLCTHGNAIIINRSYVLGGGTLPSNFVTPMLVDAELRGRITLRTLTVANDISYVSPNFLFDQELYFTGFSDIGLPRDLSVPIPLNIAPVQMRVVMGGQTQFPDPLTYMRNLAGTLFSNAEIFNVKAASAGTVDARASGLHLQIYNWVGVNYTDITIRQTRVSFEARMTDYQIFHDPMTMQLTIEAGDNAYNAIDYTNNVSIVSADTALTNRAGAVLTNQGFIFHTTRGAVLVNEGELVNQASGRIISNVVNAGTITNFGDFQIAPAGTSVIHLSVNEAGGVIQGLGGTLSIEAAGRLVNHGLISLAAGASFVNNGGLQNDGTVLVDGGTFTGALNNAGTVTLASGGVVSGDVLNWGEFTVNAGTLSVRAGDSFGNENSGVVRIDAKGAVQLTGVFGNASTSLVQVRGSFEALGTSTFSTFGTVQFDRGSRLVIAPDSDVFSLGFLTLAGVVENSGQISATAGFVSMQSDAVVANAGEFDLGGDVTAGHAGSFLNAGTMTVRQDARFTNEGVLVSTGPLSLTSTAETGLSNQGTLDFQDKGSLFVGPGAKLVNGVKAQLSLNGAWATNEGTLLNEGRLDIGAGGLSTKGTLINTGVIISGGSIVNAGFMVNEASLLSSNAFFNLSGASFVSASKSATRVTGFDNRGGVLIGESAQLLVEGDYMQSAGSTVVQGRLTANNIVISGGSLEGNLAHIVGNVIVDTLPEPRGAHTAGVGPNAGGSLHGSLIIEGNLLVDGGTLSFDIAGLGEGQHDFLTVTGVLTFARGTLALNFIDGFVPGENYYFSLVSPGERIGLEGAAVAVAGLPEGYTFQFNADGGLVVTAVPAPVPEPAAWLLALVGVACVGAAVRRRGTVAA